MKVREPPVNRMRDRDPFHCRFLIISPGPGDHIGLPGRRRMSLYTIRTRVPAPISFMFCPIVSLDRDFRNWQVQSRASSFPAAQGTIGRFSGFLKNLIYGKINTRLTFVLNKYTRTEYLQESFTAPDPQKPMTAPHRPHPVKVQTIHPWSQDFRQIRSPVRFTRACPGIRAPHSG